MTDNAPRCLYCRYNLTGLPEGSRCPECGMVSVPEALRREVWDLVDSPRRLWALMARPIAKHPPGWWWALDRPGDVRRSFGMLVRNLALSVVIVLAALVTAGSVVLEETEFSQLYDQADPKAKTLYWNEIIIAYRLFNKATETGFTRSESGYIGSAKYRRILPSRAWRTNSSYRLLWDWSAGALWVGAAAFAWLVVVWAYVAQVGLWTQIRKGLPEFAKPPRTIIAATNLQSCKLVFLALGVTLACGVEAAVRYVCHAQWVRSYELTLWGVGVGLFVAGGTMWVGALRSDFTRQLVRSWLHATRIVLMYALALPTLTVFAVWLGCRMGKLF